ncbi:hypothetical protein PoB_005722200 [Plakobranchus ocellatus]|uniref:Uncharacterized protein n=1 Tax=Plakobranchus ocellatus TaxID=259542 RepID=A0AAV4CGJ1_9GAST|nr:hypothetical protein PoB_005722200 [Plakobranchus ocellatus]
MDWSGRVRHCEICVLIRIHNTKLLSERRQWSTKGCPSSLGSGKFCASLSPSVKPWLGRGRSERPQRFRLINFKCESGCYGGPDECGCEILPDLGGLGSKETVGNLRLDDKLTRCLRSSDVNWMSWQALSPPFCFGTTGRALEKWWDKDL